MFVKPREGMRVLDPVHYRALSAEGSHVPNTGYWRRHLARGDVVQIGVPDEQVEPAADQAALPAPQAQE